jgi:glycosyltransferase 2 family protein
MQDKGSSPGLRGVLVSLALSVLVLAVVAFFTFERAAFVEALSAARPAYLLLALGMVGLRVLFGGMRLSYVSAGKLSLRQGVRGQLAWDFFSNVTPSAIGGGPFSAVFIARDTPLKIGQTTAMVLFSILLDQIFFALAIPLLIVASLYFDLIPASLGTFGTGAFVLYFAVMLTWLLVYAYFTLIRPQFLPGMMAYIFRIRFLARFREGLARETGQWTRSAQMLRSQPVRFYLAGVGLTALWWTMRIGLVVAVVLSVFPTVDAFLLFLRSVVLTIAALWLPTPGGAGGLEGLYVLFFGPMMPHAVVAPTLLLWRFLGYYIFIGAGLLLTARRRKRRGPNGRADSPGPVPAAAQPQPTAPDPV